MESYEKEMYNFFTIEQNFLSMCKVVKNYPLVTSQLKEEFWELVQIKLKKALQLNESSYTLKITGKINDERTKIMLYKINWPIANNQPVVAIAIQRLAANNYPFYGPWINNDSKEMDIESMYSLCRNSKAGLNFYKDDDRWFPFYKDLAINFQYDEEYLKIFPENRESFAEEVARNVFELAKGMDQELDEISKLKK